MKLGSDISAVVTGGASGLGEATARELASSGVKVAVFDLNEELGNKVAGEIGGVFCSCNVADEASAVAAFEAARAAHGQERILVNCAGIALGRKTVSRDRETGEVKGHDLASFKKVVEVNLIGSFNMTTLSAMGMVDAEPATEDGERGVIISTASVAAQDGQIGQVAYAASKGGVASMTLPIARDLSRDGVRVMTILPGLFHTPMFDTLPDEVAEALGRSVPFPSRLGYPSEYAKLVGQICENGMLNGECIRLDGAIRLAPK